MITDPEDSLHLNSGRGYEPVLSRLIAGRLRAGSVFLDVGAHIGWHSVQAAAVIGQTGTVIAVEPEPGLFNILVQNLCATGVPFLPVRAAAADYNGRIPLYLCAENSGDNRIYPFGEPRKIIQVLAFRLDDILRHSHLKPDVIKMDVQGAELRAITGAEDLIGHTSALAVEFWPHGLEQGGTDPAHFLDVLRGFGFTVFDSKKKGSPPVCDRDLLEAYRPETDRHTNLWCLK